MGRDVTKVSMSESLFDDVWPNQLGQQAFLERMRT